MRKFISGFGVVLLGISLLLFLKWSSENLTYSGRADKLTREGFEHIEFRIVDDYAYSVQNNGKEECLIDEGMKRVLCSPLKR